MTAVSRISFVFNARRAIIAYKNSMLLEVIYEKIKEFEEKFGSKVRQW